MRTGSAHRLKIRATFSMVRLMPAQVPTSPVRDSVEPKLKTLSQAMTFQT